MNKSGYVYFLEGDEPGLVKIGKTTREPNERIAEYSPLLPFPTKLIHVIPCLNVDFAERMIHKTFATVHLRGEWFQIGDQNRAAVLAGEWDEWGRM